MAIGSVTGLTAERMLEIEAASVTGGAVDEDGHLILTTHGGTPIDAGDVKGDPGEQGDPGIGVLILPAGSTSANVPGGTPVGTIVFVKG